MKVTYYEELEARKAWRNCMYCPKCDGYKYTIHQQLHPITRVAWWVQCDNCGYESMHCYSREEAIAHWKKSHT